jgi:2-alkyl-3-oxoalkanoate reductase
MKVLVTGASGGVGLGAVRALRRHGHEVVALVHKRRPPQLEAEGVQIVQGDLEDDSGVGPARGVDAIVHCAMYDVRRKRMNARWANVLRDTEVRWTRRLIEAGAGRASVFVHSSGAWIYGTAAEVDESSPLQPFQPALGKIDGERTAMEQARVHGYQSCVSLRLGAVYGNGVPTFDEFVVGPMKKGGRSRWIGSGEQWVPLAHIDDVGEAFAACVEKRPGYEIFNVNDDEPVQPRTYYAHLASLMGAKPPGGVPAAVASLFLGSVAQALAGGCRASNAKIKRVLGWAPSYPTYRQGMAQVVEGLRQAAGAQP